MDRIWQWAWDRYGARYTWAVGAISFPLMLPIFLVLSFPVVAFERSDRYVEAAAATAIAVLVMLLGMVLTGRPRFRLAEQWAAGHEVDRTTALEDTYIFARWAVPRAVGAIAVWSALLSVVVGVIAGATGSRLVQYGILGAVLGTGVQLIGGHSLAEASLRPVRVALAGDTGIGDALPRSRPTFAAWSSVSVLAVAFNFSAAGALVAAVFDRASEFPVLCLAIGGSLALGMAVPITVGAAFAPSLRPIRDLAEGTERVAVGDYSQRLPVVQDDDLGALAGSFNRPAPRPADVRDQRCASSGRPGPSANGPTPKAAPGRKSRTPASTIGRHLVG
jgi:HAMP domain-containing protein